jgi:transcription elongation factor Elf1
MTKKYTFMCLKCGCIHDVMLDEEEMFPIVKCPICGWVKVPDRKKERIQWR